MSRVKESRDGRVDSWRSFQAQGKKSKEKKNRSFLKPPKVKMEQRDWCSALGLFTLPSLHTFCVCSSDGLLDVLQTSHPGRPVFFTPFFFFFYTSVRRSTWAVRLLQDKQTCTCSEMSDFFCCFSFHLNKITFWLNQPELLEVVAAECWTFVMEMELF